MKKALSLILVIVLVLGLALTASAAADQKITINHNHAGHTYEAYQVFTGVFGSEGYLTQIEWGEGIKNEADLCAALAGALGADAAKVKTAEDVSKLIANESAAADTVQAKALADVLATKDEDGNFLYLGAYSATTNTLKDDGTYVLDGLEPGYYLVKDADGTQTGVGEAATYFILRVTHGDTKVTPKNGVPSVIKKVDDVNDSSDEHGNSVEKDSADHDIGDTVHFTITATMPSTGVEYYENYKLIFHDTMAKALKYVPGSAKVTFNGTDVTSYFTPEYVEGATENKLDVSCANVKAIAGVGNQSVLVLKYDATLTSDGVVYGQPGNPNTVKLEYSNDPNFSGDGETQPTGETPEDKVVVFTYFLEINKTTGGAQPEALAGADFDLYKKNKVSGEYELVDVTLDPNKDGVIKIYTYVDDDTEYRIEMDVAGKIVAVSDKTGAPVDGIDSLGLPTGDAALKNATSFYFLGLDAGDYMLKETKTPDNYNPLAEDLHFSVTATHELDSADPQLKELIIDKPDFNGNVISGKIDADIMNLKGSVLPSTGGTGTTLFYIFGALMVVGASVLLIAKKRVGKNG